jgi:hypothetical protein
MAIAGTMISERHSRLYDYLAAKGFLDGRETFGISTAIGRGKKDFSQCLHDGERPTVHECERACPAITNFRDVPSNIKALECAEKCTAFSEACKRTKACLQDFLPF